MVAGLGSLTSSPPLTSKMWSKVSMTMAEEQAPKKAPQQPTEEEGAQQAPQKAPQQPTEEEGAKQPPQQPPQQTPEAAAEEGAMSAAEAEAAEAAALRGIRRQCSLLVSTHEPTPHALLGKKVPTRRPLPPVGNVLRLWA